MASIESLIATCTEGSATLKAILERRKGRGDVSDQMEIEDVELKIKIAALDTMIETLQNFASHQMSLMRMLTGRPWDDETMHSA